MSQIDSQKPLDQLISLVIGELRPGKGFYRRGYWGGEKMSLEHAIKVLNQANSSDVTNALLRKLSNDMNSSENWDDVLDIPVETSSREAFSEKTDLTAEPSYKALDIFAICKTIEVIGYYDTDYDKSRILTLLPTLVSSEKIRHAVLYAQEKIYRKSQYFDASITAVLDNSLPFIFNQF